MSKLRIEAFEIRIIITYTTFRKSFIQVYSRILEITIVCILKYVLDANFLIKFSL